MADVRIRCPKCNWEPDGGAYWKCSTCGCVWNTFATAARCPDCGRVYKETRCILGRGGCRAMSPHLDWYEGLDGVLDNLKEEIEKGWAEPFKNSTCQPNVNNPSPKNQNTNPAVYLLKR